MRSFHLLSLLSSILLFSCFPSQALRSNVRHENSGSRFRHVNNSKRDENGAFTYFADGQGACGITNGPNDFIVALNSAEFDNGAHCFEMITITVGGKTMVAKITDECTGCQQGGLDFSSGLFQYFAPLSEGKLYGSWSYINSDATTSSTLPASTTTTSAPTTGATTSLSSTTTSSTTASPSQTSIPSAVPSSVPQAIQVIAQLDLALLQLGTLLQSSVCA